MLLLIFLLPLITSFVLLVLFRKKIAIWEYAILFIGTWLILGVTVGLMKCSNSFDTEYLGYYVTKTTHYDSWNERQRRTRTVTTGTGKHRHTHTEVYYVTVNHPEEWEVTLNDDSRHNINRKQFDKIVENFDTTYIFRDMHRHYHTKDGDAQDYFYPVHDRNKLVSYDIESSYKNKVKGSKSIFKFVTLTKEDIETYKLFDYPKLVDNKQQIILGIKFNDNVTRKFEAINALYGKDKEFRCYLLFFKDMPPMVTEYQKSYWEGGNKNELVLCFGYTDNKITWCEGFSWCDNPIIEAEAKTYFIEHPELSRFGDFAPYLESAVKTKWERKNFEDFDYLTVELSVTQLWIAFILALCINIGLGIWVVCNGYDFDVKTY